MVRVICLFSNEKGTLTALQLLLIQSVLILQSSNNDPSTRSKHRANIQSKQKDTSKNNTPKQKKDFKRVY